MTSGKKMPRPPEPACRWLRRVAAAALAWALCAPALALELQPLMQLLARKGSGEARFTEVRHVSGLEQPLRSSGVLSFQAPDQLSRRTLQPRPESFSVKGQEITLERGGRVRRLHVDAIPELSALVSAMSGVLNGNARQLTQHFQATPSGTLAQWQLSLVPDDERIARIVRELRLAGRQGDLLQVELLLADGDRSVMSIEPQAAR